MLHLPVTQIKNKMASAFNNTPNLAQSSTSLPWGHTALNYTLGVSSLQHILIGSTLIGVATVGTLFNGMAIVVFLRYRELRSPTNSFVIALCVCDFFMSVVGAPVPAYFALMESYITSSALCSLDAFTVYFLSCTSIYLLAAISVDRYVIIVKPVSSLVITQKTAMLAIAICFFFGFFWSLMPLVGWNEYSHEGIGVACSVTWDRPDLRYNSFIIALFLACFLTPFLVMTFCYLSIVFTVRKIFRGGVMKNLKRHYTIECQMIKTVILMIVLFAVSWLPYAIVSFSIAFGSPFNISRLTETIPALIAKSSCIWNPIVYVAMNSHFRAGFLSLIPFLKKKFPGDSSKDEYDVGDNQASKASKDGDIKEPAANAQGNLGNNLDRKYDPTKLGLSSEGTSLYTGKVSSTTSFISADSDRSSNRCPSENPLLSKAVSDYGFPVNDTSGHRPLPRRASDSTVLKQHSYQDNFPNEDRQKRFKKRSILTKLRKSKIRVSEADGTNNKHCSKTEKPHRSMSASDTMFVSGLHPDAMNSGKLTDSKGGDTDNDITTEPMCVERRAWSGENVNVEVRVTKSSSHSNSSVTDSPEILRKHSLQESKILFLDGQHITQC
ncbi:hypothetical protein Btru_051090 [Bulinus truncatus]|nr:hypothetical protein Btru_051090 [Bulinus truncatus]